MQKQITKCAFRIQLDVGNTNVSFQNSPLNVNIYSGSYSWEPYYFGGKAFDEAVSGRLRSQLSGYRFTASLLWDRSTSQDNLLAIASNATFGTERTLLSGSPSVTDNASTIDLSSIYNIPANDALNGLKINVDGTNYSISDSYAANDSVTLSAAVNIATSVIEEYEARVTADGGTFVTTTHDDSVYANIRNVEPELIVFCDAYKTGVLYGLTSTNLSVNVPVTVYSNVDQRTYLTFFPDASNTAVNHDVIISSIDWTAALEATIVSLPVRVDLEGQDVQNTIPTYYKI